MDDLELLRAFRRDEAVPRSLARSAARERLMTHVGQADAVSGRAAQRAGRDPDGALRRLAPYVPVTIAASIAAIFIVAAILTMPGDSPRVAPPSGQDVPAGQGFPPGIPSRLMCHSATARPARGVCSGAYIARLVAAANAMPLADLSVELQSPDLGYVRADLVRYERALAVATAVYGPAHPAVAIALVNRGGAQAQLGMRAAARASTRRAVAIFERVLGSEDVFTRLARAQLESISRGR